MSSSVLGIDYSMTSPALCYCEGEISFQSCQIHYLTSVRKCEGLFGNMTGDPFPVLEGMAKYNAISDWTLGIVKKYNPSIVFIEDYAFGATGRVFHIAENTGLLKYKLWSQGLNIVTVAPTTVKKFATGKGNSKKDAMELAFIEETKYNVKEVLKLTPKQWNPSSDIIDSYYICKYGHKELHNGKKVEETSSKGTKGRS